jgi:surface protein
MTKTFRKRLAMFWLVLLMAQLANLNGSMIQAAFAATPMELTVVTDQPNQTVSLPIYGTVTSVTVNWSSSLTDTTGPVSSPGLLSHVYADPGTYTIKIGGTSFTQFGNGATYTGASAITAVTSFGTMGIKSLVGAFAGATNLTALPASLPTGVTSLKQMVQGATKFNQDVSSWSTSTVTDMSSMFAGATAFNKTVNTWNTANVTNFSSMFAGATAFNNGDNSNIISKSMATSSNLWSFAKATNLSSMFAGATSFNQVVSGWNVTKVTDFSSIFSGATNFNQSVASWQPRAATSMTNFLHGGSWNTRTYDAILTAWAADSATAKNLTFDAGNSKFSSASASAQATLAGSSSGQFGWTITDGGQTTQKAARILSWKVRPNDAVDGTDVLPSLVAMDSEGGTDFTYSAAPSSNGVCTVSSSGRVRIVYVGECTYTATIAEDAFALAGSITTTTIIRPVTPSAPERVSASVSGRNIVVSWAIPINLGVTGISSYTASAIAGGSEYVCTAQSPAQTSTITGDSRGTNG